MKIEDLEIDFNEIEGVSERQIWYATSLREAYVRDHYDRFQEISEIASRENDRRIRSLDWYSETDMLSMSEEYSEAEKVCLFGVIAGGIIQTLKQAMGR